MFKSLRKMYIAEKRLILKYFYYTKYANFLNIVSLEQICNIAVFEIFQINFKR